jgi:polyhydroxyalkanoate synthesis repressor PhaR
LAAPREIRVYSNRRLYDPVVARYIKFDDVYALLRDGVALTIKDADEGKDCTHKVLVDVLIRRDLNLSKAEKPMLTDGSLKELIRLSALPDTALLTEFLNHAIASWKRFEADRPVADRA